MLGPAMVVLLAGGVSVIMTNTETLDTILHAMENLISGASAAAFAVVTVIVNMPLAFLIPSELRPCRPRHATAGAAGGLRRGEPSHHDHRVDHRPRPDPDVLADRVVVVGGLAIAKVGYDRYLRFVWPLVLGLFVVSATIVAIAAELG